MQKDSFNIAVIGLGYVGLPLAVAFAKHQPVVGFDINSHRLDTLRQGIDTTGEIDSETLKKSQLTLTDQVADLAAIDIYIVTVPTPIDHGRRPDLSHLVTASTTIAPTLTPGNVVVYESTVYPGAIEQVCLPVLEAHSQLKAGSDFTIGYSPERINPGDREHPLEKISKVVAGQDAETTALLAKLYGSIIEAEVHQAPDIRTAEAAKVIENTQRDLNIALMNELAIIFDRMDIDTQAVLAAAGTKWNFLPFTPGLVGGHCIGVDPYYLTYQAEQVGYQPEVILAGRRINDQMGEFIAQQTIKQLIHAGVQVNQAQINILGLTFKENCPDLRNSKVIDIITTLQDYGITCHCHDPLAGESEAKAIYDVTLCDWDDMPQADALVLCVAHQAYHDLGITQLQTKLNAHNIIIDVKSLLDPTACQVAGINLWRL